MKFNNNIKSNTVLVDCNWTLSWFFILLCILHVRVPLNSNLRYASGELLTTIIQLFLAGVDTSTNTLTWTLLYLVNYPFIQQRLYDEINHVIGELHKLIIYLYYLWVIFSFTISESFQLILYFYYWWVIISFTIGKVIFLYYWRIFFNFDS